MATIYEKKMLERKKFEFDILFEFFNRFTISIQDFLFEKVVVKYIKRNSIQESPFCHFFLGR